MQLTKIGLSSNRGWGFTELGKSLLNPTIKKAKLCLEHPSNSKLILSGLLTVTTLAGAYYFYPTIVSALRRDKKSLPPPKSDANSMKVESDSDLDKCFTYRDGTPLKKYTSSEAPRSSTENTDKSITSEDMKATLKKREEDKRATEDYIEYLSDLKSKILYKKSLSGTEEKIKTDPNTITLEEIYKFASNDKDSSAIDEHNFARLKSDCEEQKEQFKQLMNQETDNSLKVSRFKNWLNIVNSIN